MVDLLAFFFFDFLSAATLAGPLEAASLAAVMVLADCSLVTALGSLADSDAMVGSGDVLVD